ncbi:9127_t:CDS:10, partial [Entrophospora sp. SA101]
MSKKINRSEPIRKALFSKVHDVIISIQKRSNFNEPRQDLGDISKEKMLFPDNLDFFELMIELGDQLYGLVASDDIKYEEVVTKFYYMVYPKYGEHSSDHLNTVPKDNILIWLLLQLFQIERIGSGIIPRDLGSDERLFSMLVKLYNEQQVVSKDAFYLRDLSLQCATKHNILADTLYVYLVPDKLVETGKLGFPETTFLKGGAAGYKLLDLININHKHRMLLFDGETTPKVPPEVKEQNSNKFLCVSPHALDVVYKIVYSAPWSTIKSKAGNNAPIAENAIRWQHTILQIFCHRFLRFLKYSSKAPELLGYIKHSVSYLDHRQTYPDSCRDKAIWFGESELLARYMIFTLARLIKFRGNGDIPSETIKGIINSIYPQPLQFCQTTLSFFPEPLRSILTQQRSAMGGSFSQSSDKDKQVNSALKIGNLYRLLMGQALTPEDEEILQVHYSKLENQSIFLCVFWRMDWNCGRESNQELIPIIRKILIQFPPSRMATYTITLVDFIIEKIDNDPKSPSIASCCQMLDELIWKYQIVAFEHVLFALVRGHREKDTTAFQILDYLLFKSKNFSERVEYFISLNFEPRYWIEDDHYNKMMKYVERYPEFFQYEAYAMDGYENIISELKPPSVTNMPIYYSTVIRRTLPILDIVIGKLIEFGEKELLIKLLDKYRLLYRYHQTLLAFVRDLLCYYYSVPIVREKAFCKRLIRLLDFDEYDILPELLKYGSDDLSKEQLFDISYFEKVFRKLSDLQGLHIACVEVFTTSIKPADFVKVSLDIVLMNGRKGVALQPMVLHAIGLLYSFLPVDEFITKLFDELVTMILTDPHLGEFSQAFNLTGCSSSQFSSNNDPSQNNKNDLQLLYLCALIGPIIYRLEQIPLKLSECILHIFKSLNNVANNMNLEKYGDTTQALEQVYDFLHYVKTILNLTSLENIEMQNVIKTMKLAVQRINTNMLLNGFRVEIIVNGQPLSEYTEPLSRNENLATSSSYTRADKSATQDMCNLVHYAAVEEFGVRYSVKYSAPSTKCSINEPIKAFLYIDGEYDYSYGDLNPNNLSELRTCFWSKNRDKLYYFKFNPTNWSEDDDNRRSNVSAKNNNIGGPGAISVYFYRAKRVRWHVTNTPDYSVENAIVPENKNTRSIKLSTQYDVQPVTRPSNVKYDTYLQEEGSPIAALHLNYRPAAWLRSRGHGHGLSNYSTIRSPLSLSTPKNLVKVEEGLMELIEIKEEPIEVNAIARRGKRNKKNPEVIVISSDDDDASYDSKRSKR